MANDRTAAQPPRSGRTSGALAPVIACLLRLLLVACAGHAPHRRRAAARQVASSGKGGTTLLRRDFGESHTNLANPCAYHWMASNFIRYASADPGALTPADLPVDAHQLIALAAPRPLFISVGIPEQGDAHWIDQLGTFKATVAASPVYALLGVDGLLPAPTDATRLPPLNAGLLEGRLGWRQHDGGHTDRPNMPYFVDWANAQLGVR